MADTKGTDADADTTAVPDYDDNLDTIVGWNINRKDSTVTLTTQRAGDDTQRQVPEDWIQRVNENKLIEYWKSFKKPREVTIKCAHYRIFKVLDHKPGKTPRLLIHWVGYTADPEDGSASWEPLDAMMLSNEALVLKYLQEHDLTRQLLPKKRGSTAGAPGARNSTPGGGAAKTTARKHRVSSSAPPPKRPRKDAADAAAKDEEHADGENGNLEAKPVVRSLTLYKPRANAAAPPRATAASGRAPRASANQGGLFKLELNITGVPHKDIQRLVNLATELTAQDKSVTISTKVTPL